jgi:hypothetical protein
VPWYERPTFWYTALGFAFLLFIGQLIRAFYRRREIKTAPAPQKRAEWLATGTAIWAFLTFIAISAVVAIVGLDEIMMGIPGSLKAALIMPLVFVVLTLLLLVTTVRAWRAHDWTVGRRIVYSLIAVSATLVSVFFWQWNLLGWQFG